MKHIVIASFESSNGMAAWSWEAALAIRDQNCEVLLVASPTATLPDESAVDFVRFQPEIQTQQNAGLLSRIKVELTRISGAPTDFLPQLHRFLLNSNITPGVFILNGSHLQNASVHVPQYVVAWAYPSRLPGYLLKIGKVSGWSSKYAVARATLDAIGWWRKDWRAYQQVDGVIAVTTRLNKQLKRFHLRKVQAVYPGVSPRLPVVSTISTKSSQFPIALMIASLDLEEPRKRVMWMLKALAGHLDDRFNITLVGRSKNAFQVRARNIHPRIEFTGEVSRERTLDLMACHDIFLMGSCLDDWGYVVIEAMSRGMVVVAANQTPFDEIVGDVGLLYPPSSSTAFARQVISLQGEKLARMKHASVDRATRLFSRKVFGEGLTKLCLQNISD